MNLARRVQAIERRQAPPPCPECKGAGGVVVEYEHPPWKGVPRVSGAPCRRCGKEQRINVVFENRLPQHREDEP